MGYICVSQRQMGVRYTAPILEQHTAAVLKVELAMRQAQSVQEKAMQELYLDAVLGWYHDCGSDSHHCSQGLGDSDTSILCKIQ